MPNFRDNRSIPKTFSGWKRAYLLHTEKSFVMYAEKSFVMRFFRQESSILQCLDCKFSENSGAFHSSVFHFFTSHQHNWRPNRMPASSKNNVFGTKIAIFWHVSSIRIWEPNQSFSSPPEIEHMVGFIFWLLKNKSRHFRASFLDHEGSA